MIEIKITMSEITPETKVKMTFRDFGILLIAVAGFVFSGLTYLGWLPTRVDGQIVDPITKTEVETSYVKKEKLQDTVNLVEYRIQTLEKAVKSLEEQVVKNQDKTDDKLDKIIDKLTKP